ncbi:MAG TPA: hypothetical protein VHW96_13595 [Solirubrobacteraceae bacterium]|jgi:hypothetical protein|nr:hypothetical protein [Solirubrobacteraceae bacterium]
MTAMLAAHMRAAPAHRSGGWARAGLRRVPLALAMALALAVVAVGLPPTPGQNLANQAQRQVLHHDRACSPPTNRGQTIDHGSPGQAVLSLLGVLRRPPLAPDPTNKVLYGIGWDAGAGFVEIGLHVRPPSWRGRLRLQSRRSGGCPGLRRQRLGRSRRRFDHLGHGARRSRVLASP